MFDDRAHAARLLAERLSHHRGARPLVLAVPRGAASMGRILADALGGDLDVVLVRTIRAPGNPELAIGAIDETGAVFVEPRHPQYSTEELAARARQHLDELVRNRRGYGTTPVEVGGRLVIVVDDGVASGATMKAALRSVRARRPATLVAAAPVAPAAMLRALEREADEVVCLEAPRQLYAIAYHFRQFPAVSDEEVKAALTGAARHATNAA